VFSVASGPPRLHSALGGKISETKGHTFMMKSRLKTLGSIALGTLIALAITSCAIPIERRAYVGQWRKVPTHKGGMTIAEAGDHLKIVEDGRQLTGRMERNGDVCVTGATLVLPATMSFDRGRGHIFIGNSEYERVAN
jgi:hypothetical protein